MFLFFVFCKEFELSTLISVRDVLEVREDAGLPFIVNMSNEVTPGGEIWSRIYVVKFNSFRGIF